MRSALVLGTLTLTLALSSPGRGLADPEIRRIVAPQATVHANPSERAESYVTNRLKQGDVVEVIEERGDGWLKILPPEGSFSWINTRFLDHVLPNRANLVVTEADAQVPVYVGSVAEKNRPRVVGAFLRRGTQVTSIGPALPDSEGMWMPIEPPPGEYRYVRSDAVSPSVGGGANRSLAGGLISTGPVSHVASVNPSLAPQASFSAPPPDSWLQAEAAHRAGRTTEAIRLYLQVAQETVTTNPARSVEATNRALSLHKAAQNDGAAPGFVRAPVEPASEVASASQLAEPGRYYPIPADPSPTVPVQPVSTAGSPQVPGYPVTHATASPAGQGTPVRYPVYTGRLRRSGRPIDNRRTYVLESQNAPNCYVTPGPGIDLEPYVNYVVDVTGPAAYQGPMRANVMTVLQVRYRP